jgi:undecaprenyl-diphosphatase
MRNVNAGRCRKTTRSKESPVSFEHEPAKREVSPASSEENPANRPRRTGRLVDVWRGWRQRIDLVILLATLAMVLAAWGFDALANRVTEGRTRRFDDWAVESLRNPDNPRLPRGPIWFVEAVRDISALGGPTVVTLMVVAVAGYLALVKRYRDMALTVLAAASAGGLSELLKHVFQRPRPPFPSDLAHPLSSSFPSGHSMLAALVYLMLGAMLAGGESRWRVKLYFVAGAVTLAFLVGVSRVCLGAHYPSDVLAGWVAGLGWAAGWWLVSRWLDKRFERGAAR